MKKKGTKSKTMTILFPIIASVIYQNPKNTTTKENETLLAIGTAFVQGEDVAARGHVLLFSVDRNPDNSQTLILRNAVSCVRIFYPSQVPEVYSKELKGAISALASLQGHLKGAISALASLQSLLLIASGPKISEVDIWEERKDFGSRGQNLKHEMPGFFSEKVASLESKAKSRPLLHTSGYTILVGFSCCYLNSAVKSVNEVTHDDQLVLPSVEYSQINPTVGHKLL